MPDPFTLRKAGGGSALRATDADTLRAGAASVVAALQRAWYVVQKTSRMGRGKI